MACARLDEPVSPLDSQEQWPSPMSTSSPALIQNLADQYEHMSSSPHTLVYNESVKQGDHPLSQLGLFAKMAVKGRPCYISTQTSRHWNIK